MFNFLSNYKDFKAKLLALDKSQAVIEFSMDGNILTANQNFLNAMGYRLEEIKGKHHSMFVGEVYKNSSDYRQLWESLNRGEHQQAEYKRFGKGGKEVWIQASYNPIFDAKGNAYKVVKFSNFAGQIDAINKSQAVIEFALDGTIITANENFLNTVGYKLDEVVGKHHSMFVEPAYKSSVEYTQFWDNLLRGQFQQAEYKRIGKGGKEVWIQASYNPIADLQGKLVKVVKYATDITSQIEQRRTTAILSLVANETDNSVIITDTNERIEYVNPGFSKMTGYTFEEVKGKRPGELLQGKLTDPKTKKDIHAAVTAQKPFYTKILNYGKSGESYWVSLAINPVFGKDGKVERFISIQSNVNATKEKALESSMQLDAISRSQAVIEFNMDGTIITANKNFLDVLGYSLDEVKGKHHRMFVESAYAQSGDYHQFWDTLNRGEYVSQEFKRIGKAGKEVYIQASYNPIFDISGKPVKVIKFATDITAMVTARIENEHGIAESVKILSGVAAGDLTQKMELEYKGTFKEIKQSVNATVDRLYDMVQQIIETAQSVNAAASEIASGSTDLSQRTEEQASSLEETAAS
ncbi:MAG: PAS domain-containing protein, partial [Pseudomonadota bacterium]